MRLINPQVPFEWFCVNVHNLTEEHVKDAPLFDKVWEELTPLLQGAEFIVAHNAPFDKSVLYKSCARYNMEQPKHNFTCSIKAARHCWKLSSYT